MVRPCSEVQNAMHLQELVRRMRRFAAPEAVPEGEAADDAASLHAHIHHCGCTRCVAVVLDRSFCILRSC